MISFWQLLICFPLPIALAVCVTEMKNKFVSRMTQMSTLLTHFISVVVVCGIVINFLSPSTGVINLVLEKIGVDPVYFMTKPEYFKGIYTLMTLWQNAGFDALVYIVTMLILKLGGIIKVGYEAILLLYQPATYSAADVISTYSYRLAFENGNYGLSVAAGLFESVVAFIMVILANRFSKKISDNALW